MVLIMAGLSCIFPIGNIRPNPPQVNLIIPDREYMLLPRPGKGFIYPIGKTESAYQVYYLWNGSRRRFLPDFLVRLSNGKTLVLEVKGEDSEQDRAKRSALDAWVKGVNAKGGFGTWCWDVALKPAEIHDIVQKHASTAALAH